MPGCRRRWPRHYGRLYGTRAEALLDEPQALGDLGRHFGALLYEREARFLCAEEWARPPRTS